jgi:VCBS repeat-containing protein
MRTKLRGKVTLLFLTLGLLLAVPAVALAADVVVPDGDLVTPLNQAGDATNPINLGPVKGGVQLTKDVSFELQCASNNNHVDDTQGVDIAFLPAGGSGSTVPAGATATATNAHIGATSGTDPGVPTSWPNDGQNCSTAGTSTTPVQDNGNSTVTITPPSAEGTYDFVIKYQTSVSPVGNNDGQALQGNGVVSVFYRLTVDNTAPRVTAVSPSDGATNVLKGSNVEATFSEDMNAATLNDAEGDGNFTLKKTSDNSLVGAVVSYNATDKKATLNPNADLAYNTQYTATVTTGATDVAGNALDQDSGTAGNQPKTWTFTTEPPPNTAPVANKDSYNVNEGGTLNVPAPGVLGNDTDADNNPLTATLVGTGPSNASSFSFNPDGSFNYTPAANYNGPDSFTYKANDGTADSNVATVTINVASVNDEPSFTAGANQTVNEDSGAHSVAWATAISAGPNETQTLNFEVTNDNNALFSNQPAISADGTLSYTPAANAHGTATVSVTLHDDGGTANGGDDTSATQTFTITVNAVNDEPSFTKGANETVLENSGAHSVSGWATAISAGPADESGQALDFIVTNDKNSLFTATGQPKVAANGTLTYTLAPDAIGTATVDVKLHDDGGTANGGVDTSATQSFTIDVNYKFDGFRSPVDNPGTATPPVFNSAKAGQSIPIKFSLFGN